MSSHHFVKEYQEPALLILNTEGYNFEMISPLLEWVPTVLVEQEALETVISWGIKIDAILGSESFEEENPNLLEEQFPVRFLRIQSESMLEEALEFLKVSQHSAVNVIGFDHTAINDIYPKLPLLDMVIWDGPLRYYPVKNGKFKKWFPACSIQLHGKENMFVEMENEAESVLIPIQHATFVDLKEGTTIFRANEIFWIGEFISQ